MTSLCCAMSLFAKTFSIPYPYLFLSDHLLQILEHEEVRECPWITVAMAQVSFPRHDSIPVGHVDTVQIWDKPKVVIQL